MALTNKIIRQTITGIVAEGSSSSIFGGGGNAAQSAREILQFICSLSEEDMKNIRSEFGKKEEHRQQ